MSGMGGPATHNSLIVSAFQSRLTHQLVVLVLVLAVVLVAWNALRGAQFRQAVAQQRLDPSERASKMTPEPAARRLLRISFGLIWVFDGVLQAQAAMPVGLGSQVLQPTAAGSPGWVQHLVNIGVTIWNNHPVEAAVAAVWVQVGIGVWLLVAPRGRWSQVGALASVAWGLVVWGFGEAFGGIFAPGVTILFGAPGAVLFYCVAGGLVALPERVWGNPRLGRWMLRLMGLFFIGFAVLQAWPGRGFWQGQSRGHPAGTLVGMVQSMASTPQPGFLSSWVRGFSSFDGAHGFAVNLVVVILLAGIGGLFLTDRPQLVRIGIALGCLFCLADWILVEDLGFWGGLGTDPNSMVPMALLFISGYIAWTRAAPIAAAPAPETEVPLRRRLTADPVYALRSLAALAAVGVTLLGAAPMALASTNPTADPVVTEATNGTPGTTNLPAPPFSLIDQGGHRVTLASLRGRPIALTFLDPVCTTDCPLIAQEFRDADLQLGHASRTEFIAVVANPLYRSTFFTNEFDHQEGLSHLGNWLYLTGTVAQLHKVWDEYSIQTTVAPAGAMVDHSEAAYIIDPRGRTRYILSAAPSDGDASGESSFVGLLLQELRSVGAQ